MWLKRPQVAGRPRWQRLQPTSCRWLRTLSLRYRQREGSWGVSSGHGGKTRRCPSFCSVAWSTITPLVTTSPESWKPWPTNWTYVNMLDTPGSTRNLGKNVRCYLSPKTSLDVHVTWPSDPWKRRDTGQPIRAAGRADVARLAELGTLGSVIATLELETKSGFNLAYPSTGDALHRIHLSPME